MEVDMKDTPDENREPPFPQELAILSSSEVHEDTSSESPLGFAHRSKEKSPWSKLSPKSSLTKTPPSKAKKRALTYVKGKTPKSRGDPALLSSSVNIVASTKDEQIVSSFDSQLALAPRGLPILQIAKLFELVNFRFAFEGKVLCKYGTYKIQDACCARYLKADLVDREAKHTVTLVVGESYISHFVDSFEVDSFLPIEGACVRKCAFNDGGTCALALHADATTVVLKAKPFNSQLVLFPEHSIKDLFDLQASAVIESVATVAFTVVKIDDVAKSDGSNSFRLMIADGPSSTDRASLLFVPTRRADYHCMVSAIHEHGFYGCVAHNINIFRQHSNTLSIVDSTILCSLPTHLEVAMEDALNKQIASLGFGKKVFGTLKIVNINNFEVDFICETCKGNRVNRVNRQTSNPFCFSCNKVSEIMKVPTLKARITKHDGNFVVMELQGKVVDFVLCFPQPFVELYDSNLVELKSSLTSLSKVGTFSIDNQGQVTA